VLITTVDIKPRTFCFYVAFKEFNVCMLHAEREEDCCRCGRKTVAGVKGIPRPHPRAGSPRKHVSLFPINTILLFEEEWLGRGEGSGRDG